MSTLTQGPDDEAIAEIAIIDYGLGNLRSVTRGLERAGATVTITDDASVFQQADGVVLPGVGAFREGMDNAGPFRDAILSVANSETPLFGICLGMQMLLTESEEATRAGQGAVRGLDLIPGRNVRFSTDQTVPHMGWNQLTVQSDHPIAAGIDGEYAYFVHSYYAQPDDPSAVVTTTEYGTTFPSLIADETGTVFGTQFHPEKSGATGLQILTNFVEIAAETA